MEQIRREAGATESRLARRPLLGLPRVAWGGICALSLGFVLFFTMIPRGDFSDPHAKYVAEVLKTKTADPKGKATVETKKDMTIIKLEGLDKLPPGQRRITEANPPRSNLKLLVLVVVLDPLPSLGLDLPDLREEGERSQPSDLLWQPAPRRERARERLENRNPFPSLRNKTSRSSVHIVDG